MSTFGRIEEFQPGRSVWKEYYERLDFFFTANDITEDVKKRAVFLSVCGPSLYSIIRSLSTPAAPSSIDFNDIILKLNAHFAPTPSEILSRFHFHKRDQRPQESISDFLAEIRRLSEHCNFGNQLDSMLRDRLVCGLKDEHIQRRLLANSKLTLQTATDEALSGEAATRHAQEIRGSTSEVLQLKNSKNTNLRSSKKEQNSKEKKKHCFRCGEIHPFGECKFINATCYFCNKVGHITKVCNAKNKTKVTDSSKKKMNNSRVAKVETDPRDFENSAYQTFHHVNCLRTVGDAPPDDISVKLNGLHHTMEIDNGSLHSIIGTSNFVKLWPVNPPELLPVSRQLLRTWNSEKLDVKGYINVQVSHNKVNAKLPLVVVQGSGKSLIGRSWFDTLGIKVIIEGSSPVNLIREKSIDKLIEKYKRVFSVELGTFEGPPLTIKVDEKQAPVFFRARNVPFALRDRVSKELENMISKGILESVTYSDWATPIVPVIKKDGSIRICGDYRCTINQAVKQFTYPLPTVNEVLATVSGGTVFSKLDLSEAYLQLPVDEPTSRLLTLNTHKGLFRVKRLPFGVSVAVAIFQKRMEEVLAGIDGVLPYLDDIFIMGKDIESHNLKLQQVLERLDREGIRLRKEKCKFAVSEIILLGFRVNANGIQPTADKVAAIHQAPTPSNVTELQAFLGLLNFYGCFLKNRSNVLQPLHQLLQKDTKWCWTVEHDRAYKAAKELLQGDDLLVHYDEKRPLILTCDASSYGLGAVLSHELPDGSEAPIAYYSRTMMKAEQNYSQTDKEALAIVAAVKKFHSYLFGRKFKIITDHKPLLGLLNPTKTI